MLSEAELLTLRNDLHFQSRGGEKYGFGGAQSVSLLNVDEDSGIVTLPRRYAYERLPKKLLQEVEDKTSPGTPVDIVFNEEKQSSRPDLKKRQDGLIGTILEEMKKMKTPFQGGIGCAPCGTGKTVVSTKLMSIFNTTTVVLVHKEFLMNQWKERIIEFTNVKEEEIGYVKQKKCDFEGKKVVIAMIQSLMDPDKYPKEFFEWGGLLISDEVHRMSAPCFQSVIPLFPARVRIGLSATPRRADGLQPVFEWHIGGVLARIKGNELTPKIYQIPFDIWFPENTYLWRDKETGKIKKMFLAKLTNLLVESAPRNVWFMKEMLRAAKAGRQVMLLSDRREHLELLKRSIEAKEPSVTVGLYVGGMKKKDRERSESCDIILGTFQMCREGLDIARVDTLFLSCPKSDVEQIVGRALRYHEDKKDPIIVDLVDSIPACLDFARKRLRQYKKLGYTVVRSVED
jgi:superfamily II DNA or RNA helicase